MIKPRALAEKVSPTVTPIDRAYRIVGLAEALSRLVSIDMVPETSGFLAIAEVIAEEAGLVLEAMEGAEMAAQKAASSSA